jgi:hypothetical protein
MTDLEPRSSLPEPEDSGVAGKQEGRTPEEEQLRLPVEIIESGPDTLPGVLGDLPTVFRSPMAGQIVLAWLRNEHAFQCQLAREREEDKKTLAALQATLADERVGKAVAQTRVAFQAKTSALQYITGAALSAGVGFLVAKEWVTAGFLITVSIAAQVTIQSWRRSDG